MTPSPVPDGTPILLRYNEPSSTGVFTTVEADEYGDFTMPALVQMYDCIYICKGTTLVGVELSITRPQGVIDTATGVEENGNTRFSWRITQMPTEGQLWVVRDETLDFERNIKWPV